MEWISHLPSLRATQTELKLFSSDSALARAHIWFEDLKAGHSYKEIAVRESIDQRHVARTIRLAFLAPDIVESIFKGNAPVNLTVDHLLRLPDFPVEWQNQREVLQFI